MTSASATFRLPLVLPERISRSNGQEILSREAFFERAWLELEPFALQGIHEGTVLSEEAFDRGLETESWTVDSGEAPRERDWVAAQEESSAELYFETREQAEAAWLFLKERWQGLVTPGVEEVPLQDWDAQWKASFQGVNLAPHWRVCPPWSEVAGPGRLLRLNPGAGFGTGTHETTQLCLGFLGDEALRRGGSLEGFRALDFGSGSGILSIGAALLGAQVDGVEIDPLAIDNAKENVGLNPEAVSRIRFSLELDTESQTHQAYDLVIANILRPVLIEFAPRLVAALRSRSAKSPAGVLILSGLIDSDVAPVVEAYERRLGPGWKSEVRASGDWRAIRFAETR
jgi:ribosomal protein L11 methyltransferase